MPADSTSRPELISEPITPTGGSFDTADMGKALPGLPKQFRWRQQTCRVGILLEKWKASGPMIGKLSGEMYLRRHYFRVRTTDGKVMVLYCERKARSRSQDKSRWFLYTVETPGAAPVGRHPPSLSVGCPDMSIKKMHKSPREYDLSVNWLARIEREIPVLASVFGKPSELPILDAGCGPGRQAAALAGKGYRLVGADKSPDMIDYARNLWSRESSQVEWRVAGYAQMVRRCPGPFAGVYCIGNSLSACGSAAGIHKALHSFSSLLAPGGMLFVQVLNYPPMKSLVPCVKGPTHYFIDGVEHVRFRVFDFARNSARVTNVTLRRKDKGWAADSMCGRLCACSPAELKKWCADAGLQVMEMWGSYAGEKFDSGTSVDAIIIARRKKARS